MYCPMYMPPPQQPQCHAMWQQPPSRKDEDIIKTFSKLMKLMDKDKKDKKKSAPPKSDPFMLFIFLTAISPIIGSGGVYIMSLLLKMTFENLQAIVH